MTRVRLASSSGVLFVSAFASVLAGGTRASAIETTECASAYERAQIFRRDSKFRAAREQLAICAQKGCPAFIVDDCAEWARELDDTIPTVIISALDEQGRDLREVRVAVDGVPLLSRLDGQAVAIDPGSHQLRFESDTAEDVENDYVVHPGERSRTIVVRLHARKLSPASRDQPAPSAIDRATASDSPTGRDRTPAIVFGAAGIAGLAGFAYFGLTGRAEVSRLRAECAPVCNPSDTDAAKQKLLAADVSLGFSVVSLGVATWLFLSGDGTRRSPPKAALEIAPTATGGTAEVAVTF